MIADTTTSTYAGTRTITAFFDSHADAERAVERVVAAGVERSSVSVRAGSDSTTTTTTTKSDDNLGFWDSLKDLFLPDEDRATYAEGLRRGGYLVTVQTGDAHVERVVDILDDEGTVNLDERAESWRSEGWTGHTSASTGYAAAPVAAASTAGYAASGSSTAGAVGTLRDGSEETISLTEEQLRVGKREVAGGRIRVRSYVVETPVQEQVSLRQEHVHVERHAVDRPVTGTEDAFRERVIEAEERSEEAVISKEARVVEELTIRKDAEQTTRTISDTVRRTEVEVEDDRTVVDRNTTVTGTRDRNAV